MAKAPSNRTTSRDGWLIRLSLVCFVALVAIVYLFQSGNLFNVGTGSQFASPQMLVVPTESAIEPDIDDVIIFDGESVRRRLDKGGIQNWTFNGAANSLVDITLMPNAVSPPVDSLTDDEGLPSQVDPGFNPVLELYTPSGDLLLKANDFGPDQPELLRGVELPEAGEYTVWVTDETYEHGATYTLTFTPYFIKATHPQRIGVGEALRSDLDKQQFQMWVFSAEAGQEISITALALRNHDENFQPHVDLYSPNGELLASFEGVERKIPMPDTGNYSAWVMDKSFANSGDYMLSIQASNAKEEINLRP